MLFFYVKDGINYHCRRDLEPRSIECIWIEIINKHILFGVFYRSPNAVAEYFVATESLNLEGHTGYNDIIVAGDGNLNIVSNQSARKINSVCTEFAFYQSIDEPTHHRPYFKSPSSLIDLVLVHIQDSLVTRGVGDPFLGQDSRCHCPITGILKFSKPKSKSYTRQIWN